MDHSDDIYHKIIELYIDNGSIKETALALNTTEVKVRKVLITEGLWSSKKSLEIQHYVNMGKTTREIADILCTTEKAVQQYLPYTRGIYKGDILSVSAVNSANYRERIRRVQENTLRRNMNMAIENRWGEMNKSVGEDVSCNSDIIRLHLELERKDDFSEGEHKENTRVLKNYGNVKGETISRDILVPSDMPLWALNYVIQSCFGWQNSHLHCFNIPEERFNALTDNDINKYYQLVGVVFRSPWMNEDDEFWCDDYEKGSFKVWLRKKYTGPYCSLCYGEGIVSSKNDVYNIKKRYKYVEVDHKFTRSGEEYYGVAMPISYKEYKKRIKLGAVEDIESENKYTPKVFNEVYRFEDVPMEAMKWVSERPVNILLERLSVVEVLVLHDKGLLDDIYEGDHLAMNFDDFMDDDLRRDIEEDIKIDSPYAQPYIGGVTDVLYFNYDFGDNWIVKITGSYEAEDLIEAGRLSIEELDEAYQSVRSTYRPVCIAQDGYPVLDDVGGFFGYIRFLRSINESPGESKYDNGPYDDKESSLIWAKSLGWSKRRISNRRLL